MSWAALWALLSNFLGSTLAFIWPLVLAGGVVVGFLYFLEWLKAHPDNKWNMYYPLVLGAVKYAEKAIPDDTPNKSWAKADAALKEFNARYEAETGKPPSEALKIWFKRVKELALMEIEKSKNKTV